MADDKKRPKVTVLPKGFALPKITIPEADPNDVCDDPGPTRAIPAPQPLLAIPEIDADEIFDDPGPTRAVMTPTAPGFGSNPLAIPLTTEKGIPSPFMPKVTAPKMGKTTARPEVTGRTRAVPSASVLKEIESAMAKAKKAKKK